MLEHTGRACHQRPRHHPSHRIRIHHDWEVDCRRGLSGIVQKFHRNVALEQRSRCIERPSAAAQGTRTAIDLLRDWKACENRH
jgi:hypothetical protein